MREPCKGALWETPLDQLHVSVSQEIRSMLTAAVECVTLAHYVGGCWLRLLIGIFFAVQAGWASTNAGFLLPLLPARHAAASRAAGWLLMPTCGSCVGSLTC